MRDGSSLFVIAVLTIALMAGAAWVYSRYRPSCPQSAAPIGCRVTPLP